MRTRHALSTAVALALTGLACQPAGQEAASGMLTDADIAAIEGLAEQWAQHAKMGHADVVAGLYSENAMELPPDEPAIRGRAAIQARLEEDFTTLQDITITPVETEGRAGLAFSRGTYSATVMEEGMEEPASATGKWIAIVRQGADGTWHFSRLIWNTDEPTPQMPEPMDAM